MERIEKNISMETAIEVLAEQIAREAAAKRRCLLADDVAGAEQCKNHLSELMQLRTNIYKGDLASIALALEK